MLRRCLPAGLIALTLVVPNLASAEETANPIRAAIAEAKIDVPSSARSIVVSAQRAPTSRQHVNGLIVAGLATIGAFTGMYIASKVALPCHCGDPETVVARGGLIGAGVGAVFGVVITHR